MWFGAGAEDLCSVLGSVLYSASIITGNRFIGISLLLWYTPDVISSFHQPPRQPSP
ncbi:hypothetical protein EX30DRAFT_340978 [Ascodesmis nigricans]|uniref:Uncharacterized protein n=1 Tax=Ascodesmis nigricans TaxID=341454 RepID=A0A4S2MWR0_9PEZI|nr:hypothetical protein EX30DRAFT_340978 [Ascodesmis nigricans]